jgi:hypothetical protein
VPLVVCHHLHQDFSAAKIFMLCSMYLLRDVRMAVASRLTPYGWLVGHFYPSRVKNMSALHFHLIGFAWNWIDPEGAGPNKWEIRYPMDTTHEGSPTIPRC